MRRVSSILIALSLLAALPAHAAEPNLACMQAAVEKYHNALIGAFDAYVSLRKPALTVRRDALKTAWGITDRTQRKQAVKNAEKAFKNADRTARNVMRQSERSARKTFNAESEACGA